MCRCEMNWTLINYNAIFFLNKKDDNKIFFILHAIKNSFKCGNKMMVLLFFKLDYKNDTYTKVTYLYVIIAYQ